MSERTHVPGRALRQQGVQHVEPRDVEAAGGGADGPPRPPLPCPVSGPRTEGL